MSNLYKYRSDPDPIVQELIGMLDKSTKLLKHVADQLDRYSYTPPELEFSLIIEPLENMIREYLGRLA